MKTYQIHLIRNGRTDDSTSGRYIGHTDAILSPEGVAELHRLKEQADYPYAEAVFTSPLKRHTRSIQSVKPLLCANSLNMISVNMKVKRRSSSPMTKALPLGLLVGRMPPRLSERATRSFPRGYAAVFSKLPKV